MKIGITCYPTVGGSGILATRLGVELAKRDHEVHFITYERPVAIQHEDPENVSVHLVSVLEYPLFKYPPYTIALASEMFRVSEQQSLDVLHVHYSIPHSTAAYLSRRMTEVPYNQEPPIWATRPRALIQRSFAVRISRACCPKARSGRHV